MSHASTTMPLRCPRCAFEWLRPESRWDDFGSCDRCGALLVVEADPPRLRGFTEDDLLSVEDMYLLRRQASRWMNHWLHVGVACPSCGGTGAVAMAADDTGKEVMQRVWRALEDGGVDAVAVGPCVVCETPLSVQRAAGGRYALVAGGRRE